MPGGQLVEILRMSAKQTVGAPAEAGLHWFVTDACGLICRRIQ